MKLFTKVREIKGLSQRRLAALAGVSFRTVQLLEWEDADPQLSTLQKIATGLGYPKDMIERKIRAIFQSPPDSIFAISEHISKDGESSWKGWLFNFVDAFRKNPRKDYVQLPPSYQTTRKVSALLASTVEFLCREQRVAIPPWCSLVPSLSSPWFIAGIENLKSMTLMESPVEFRQRNIFVLGNFLERR